MKLIHFIQRHLFAVSVFVTLIMGFVGTAGYMLLLNLRYGAGGLSGASVVEYLFFALACSAFLVYPFVLTVYNLFFWGSAIVTDSFHKIGVIFEWITIFLGFSYTCLAAMLTEIQWGADWQRVLYNNEVHTPVFTQALPTVIVLSLVGIVGYLIVSLRSVSNTPPLVIVIGIAAMYIGMAECILWIVQVALGQPFLCLFPANCILIGMKAIAHKVYEWKQLQKGASVTYQYKAFNRLNQKLINANLWPLAGFIVMLPLLGIFIAILTLFGQQPDAFVRAWTETSDWQLSQKIAPQNVYRDEHYLCTVAAGGHRRVVHPIRMGERRGHRIVVNRQLCIANAFEQLLEERTPRFHRALRNFYDTYGFPIARLIHSRFVADIVYFIMKPLEWLFLIVLYCCDVKPENRIAVQYLPPQSTSQLQ